MLWRPVKRHCPEVCRGFGESKSLERITDSDGVILGQYERASAEQSRLDDHRDPRACGRLAVYVHDGVVRDLHGGNVYVI